MVRLVLLLLVFLAFVPGAWAIQLGDNSEQIIAQYGRPAAGSLEADRGMGTYRWTGWRLDVEIIQGTVQRLIFTKDTGPVSEAEAEQLLKDNGGFVSWQPMDHVATDALAGRKWRRTADGAEAFTLAGDPRVMCLATRAWADAWTRAHSAVRPPHDPPATGASGLATPTSNTPGPLAHFLAGLIVLVGFIGGLRFLGKTAWNVARTVGKRRGPAVHGHRGDGLWVPRSAPQRLRSDCAVMPPPPPPPAATHFPTFRLPTSKTLDSLSWQEFELMIGELYRRRGYTVEMCSGDGSDGGVDLWLRKDAKTVLVQCKHWKVYKVGVAPVRELFGILNAERADHAVLVTTGRFTPDACSFAAGKAMELIDGEQLQPLVEASRYSIEGDLLDVPRWSAKFARAATITAPVCPFCRSAMVLRRGKQSGNQFWGCPTYPGCRGRRNVRPELLRA